MTDDWRLMTGDSIFDLIVIGGGPAGTAAALTARHMGVPPARILLLERGSFPRHKVCGEFVSAEALRLLHPLLAESSDSLLRVTRARLFLGRHEAEFAITPPAASIARYELDAALWRAAESSGIDCRQQITVEKVQHCGKSFCVSTSCGPLEARCIIDASGRWSKLRHDDQARLQTRTKAIWLGLKAHFAAEVDRREHAVTELYFFDGGYCGVQPAGRDRINVCAMVSADRATRMEEVFALHPLLHERSHQWTQVTSTVTTAPLRFRPVQPLREEVLCVGDAAGFIDPFVGDGISMALRSGALAGGVLAAFCHGRLTLTEAARWYEWQYRRQLQPAFRNAARARWLLHAAVARQASVWLMRIPAIARLVVGATR